MRPSSPFRVARTPLRLLALAMLAALAVACSSGEPGAVPEGAPPPTPPVQTAPAATAMGTDDLASKAQQAVADNRIYAPEGDNAIEFYLAQREREPAAEASAEAALIELQPYAMMAAEQAIAGADFPEAERLIALMVRIDATAPSLVRLREDINAARKAQAADLAAAEAAEAEAEAAAKVAATAAPPPATSLAPAPRPSAEPPSRAPGTAVRTPSPAPAPARPAKPAQAAAAPAQRPAATPATPARSAPAAGPLVPVSTPFPPFPSEAIARGRSMGSVTVRFTVRANGRVADVQVVEARPEGLFERTVIDTLGEWRFEPGAGDRTETRTFNFRN
jgi:protein TonB